jgi:uncharacterized protein YcfJ
MKNAKTKTALAAVALAAATFATPLTASAADYRKCKDTNNGVAGGVIGGSVGAAIGEQIAGRGDRTEGAVLGAIIGGIAGAAIGDGVSDCEKDKRFNDRRHVTTYYPTQTRNTNRGYRNVGHHSNRNRSYGYNQRNRNYSYDRGYGHTHYGRSGRAERLYQIDRQIDDLRRERAFIKEECRRSRYARPRLERRLDKIAYRLDELKRERKRLKKGKDYRRDYRHAYHGY